MMNRIFSEAQPAAAPTVVEEETFQIQPPPKIAGIGRLDASADTANDTGSGRIAAIGKFLLDQKDLDKIGKLTSSDNADGKLRILTSEASNDLQALLGQIGSQQGVLGSVIVGHDGLLIANTMPGDMDAESVGVWALGVYMNTEHVTKKMGHERVHQVVSRTPKGYVVIADFGGGLLVTVTEGQTTDLLIPLMRTITQLVN
jgi:predicted regulator of Ras-like GTPase activity (Roadblock/LC7/MglB family)